jgi:hypothetical protein
MVTATSIKEHLEFIEYLRNFKLISLYIILIVCILVYTASPEVRVWNTDLDIITPTFHLCRFHVS